MVLGAVTGGTLMAGKLLPFLLKAGSASKLPLLLRTAGVVGGATPSLLQGDLGGALLGGGLGAVGTLGMANTVGKLGTGAAGLAAKGVGATGLGAMKGLGVGGNLAAQELVAAGVKAGAPIAAGLGLGRLAGGVAGASGNVGKAALGLAGYGTVGGEGMSGRPLPPGMGPYGNIGLQGNPIDVINPLGLDAGRRLRTVKDAEALRDAQNIVLPTVRKFAEQAKRDEFARDMASKGIDTNLRLGAALAEAQQRAALDLGTTAARQAGEALTGRFRYN